MLAACLFGPILMAVLVRYGVPALERLLVNSFGVAQVLTPYYGLFDLFVHRDVLSRCDDRREPARR